uniref:Peptidase S1 domain-containing protein n=1 Tax=Setaria italica TaxID=4555 RepID=K3YJK3_SETIT
MHTASMWLNCLSISCQHVVKSDLVLTSSHCMGVVDLEDEDVLCVRRPKFPRGVEQLPATIIYRDIVMDVAVLGVAGLTCVSPLRFAPEEDATVGESVISVGYCDPDALLTGVTFSRLPSLSPGLVKGTRYICTHQGIELYHVLLSCVCMEGMSGGPILSRRGVIGMVDCGGRGAIEMGGHSYTEAKAPHTIIEVLKRCLVLQGILTMEEAIGLELTMEEVLDLIA